MKKQILVAAVAFMAGSVLFTSCKKEDLTAPVITVTGGTAQTQTLPATAGAGTWTNPTATATDDEDGDISSSVSVSGTVDANTAGTYELTYTVSDAAGNSASTVVTVVIANAADFLDGTYVNATDTCQTTPSSIFNATVTASNTVNNDMVINNFGAFGLTININGTLSGSTINIPSSQVLGGGASIVVANGTILSTTAPVKFKTNYTWTDGSSTEVCRSWYTHQ